MLTIRPVGAQDTSPAQRVYEYTENDDSIIAGFDSVDVEFRNPVYTLGGTDAASFKIDDSGNLNFKNPPNYEVPTDDDANNVYEVTVRIGAGGQDGTPDPVDDYRGDDLREIELKVTVINEDEPGTLVFSPIQPQIGTPVRAILTDDDNIDTDRDTVAVDPGLGEWQWYSSPTEGGTFTAIPGTASAPSNKWTYTPTDDDLGKYLKVVVEYRDSAGPEPPDVRDLSKVTAHKVRRDISTSNDPPKYPDQRTLTGVGSPTTILPEQGRTVADRFIRETAAAGDIVGAPVTAFDDDATIDILTYSLRDPVGVPGGVERFREHVMGNNDPGDASIPIHKDGHAANFDINPESGQITVHARARLDADIAPAEINDAINPYTVVVRAVDADGQTKDITVYIHVLEIEEPPKIDRVYVMRQCNPRRS